MKKISYTLAISGILTIFFTSLSYGNTWQILDKGIFYANFQGTYKTHDFDIYILKIDPAYYSLQLLMASKSKQPPKTLEEWAQRYSLIAAINASMFWKDQKTSTGYMRDRNIVNQHHIHKKYGGFLAFNPKIPGIPYIKIIEMGKDTNWMSLLKDYDTVIQNFRMIGMNGKNLWHKDNNSYSVSAVGIDYHNYILFIFSLIPLPIHELNNILLSLPINISSCLFTEGGSTAGLYIKIKNFKKDLHGYSPIGIFPSISKGSKKIPNIIGVVRKPQGAKRQ